MHTILTKMRIDGDHRPHCLHNDITFMFLGITSSRGIGIEAIKASKSVNKVFLQVIPKQLEAFINIEEVLHLEQVLHPALVHNFRLID